MTAMLAKKYAYKDHIDYTLHGIPCLIGVIDYLHVKGSFSYNAPSDVDYYGYTEVDYDILDRKGYRARWLDKYITPREEDNIRQAVIDFYSE